MGNLDDIKRKLNIENLNDDERKKLFKDFTNHGGKAVDLEEEKRRKRQSGSISKKQSSSSNKKNYSSSGQKKSTANLNQNKVPLNKNTILKRNKPSLFQKFGTKLFSFFNRVTNFSGFYFHPNFIHSATVDFLDSFLNLQRVSIIILHSKSMSDFDIKHYFFKKYPLYYELLLKINQIKIDDIIAPIKEKEKTSPSLRIMKGDLEKEVTSLFKILYILLPYKKHLPEAYREGFRILEKKEKMPSSVINTYMGKVRRDVMFIFEKFMVKLFYAFLQIVNLNFKINSRELPIFLELKNKDKVTGMQSEIEKEFKSKEEKTKNEENEKEKKTVEETEQELNLSDDIKEGIVIIDELDFTNFGNSKESPFYYYDKKDKVYKVAAILDHFEREYSFLMTGTKVKYYMEHHEGQKFDPKKELNEEYLQINTVIDNIREYSQQIKEINKTEENSNIPAMQKHNLIHKATIQKSKISMSLRARLANAMQQIQKTLDKIIKNHNIFLAEPEKKLFFNDMGQNKSLAGKTHKEAIEDFFSFISAFNYLLTQGNLGGAGNVIRS